MPKEREYDKDIQALFEASEKLEADAKRKREAAEELISKRYGMIGYIFSSSIGLNRSRFPKKTEDQEKIVEQVVAPWLEKNPDGWTPSAKNKRQKKAKSSSKSQAQEIIENDVEEDAAEDEQATPDAPTPSDDDYLSSDDDRASDLFGGLSLDRDNW